jgi:putative oxidoreductase
MAAMLELLTPYLLYLALFLRVVVGVTMVMHGYPKLKNPKQTLQWAKGFGVPTVATYLAIILEFFGGIALVVGFLVPVVAFFLTLEMTGNVLLKRVKMKAKYLQLTEHAYEIDVTYLLLSITLLVLGSGAFSLDGLLGL